MSTEQVFTEIYRNRKWRLGLPETVSGGGSTLAHTEALRSKLPDVFAELDIKSIFDAPCGDFNWMKEVDLTGIKYIGADVVEELIADLQDKHAKPGIDFVHADILEDKIPEVDLWLCRDCLQHFSIEDIFKALNQLSISNVKYFASTNFPEIKRNTAINTGGWRELNLLAEPFASILPSPFMIIPDVVFDRPRNLSIWKMK